MNRMLAWSSAALLTLSLGACGFHLRGLGGPLKAMPFASLSVDGSGAVYNQVLVELKRDGRVGLPGKGVAADAVLQMAPESTSKDVLTVNRAGKVSEYQLTLRQSATLIFRHSDDPVPLNVVVRRQMSYSEQVVLGKEQEEAQLWAGMQREAANQLVRRLAYIQRPQTDAAAAGPANVTGQP
ncbi:LPS-assembly lipoprotein LptE [Craterilacuibacter sp.]|uniref:LPS-assembly lipoprotein LptE n=1 Tax=Craterilacuibacter sp. TaxID=2870909 RepID=UPI003F343843